MHLRFNAAVAVASAPTLPQLRPGYCNALTEPLRAQVPSFVGFQVCAFLGGGIWFNTSGRLGASPILLLVTKPARRSSSSSSIQMCNLRQIRLQRPVCFPKFVTMIILRHAVTELALDICG